jgi:GNAT superfamily N-acetyltransferase
MDDGALVRRPFGQPGDLGWMVMAHGEVYAEEFGWDATLEAFIGRIVLDYAEDHDPVREAAWIAELDGERVGGILCVTARGHGEQDGSTAQLRVLLVRPEGRGHGAGGRLVDTCVDFAVKAGYARMRLWTNHPLTAARSIYVSRGFRLVDEEPHRSFGVDLIGQTYELALGAAD